MDTFAKMLAVALPCLGAATAISIISSKATDSMARQPEVAGKIQSFAFVALALAEATAIYGLLIAIMMN